MKIAGLDLGDDEARVRVARIVGAKPEGARDAREFLKDRRSEYLTDRAYRLVVAAITGGPVMAVDIDKEKLFSAEAELGRLPINDAFARITELCSRLEYTRHRVEADPTTYGNAMLKEVGGMVGPRSDHIEGLARSRVAVGIAMEYLAILSGDTRRGGIDTCYFDISSQPRGAVQRS